MVRFMIQFYNILYVLLALLYFVWIFSVPSSAPQNLTIVVQNSRSLLLNWLPPPLDAQNGIIRSYSIFIYIEDTRQWLELNSNETEFVFDLAHPFYTYEIAVAAVTIGAGNYTETQRITTPEDGKCINSSSKY